MLQQHFDLFLIFLIFRVLHLEHLQKVISGIRILRTFQLNSRKVLSYLLCRSLINDVAVYHEYQLIEQEEGITTWLMNSRYDSLVLMLCQSGKHFDDLGRTEAVKTRCWLIQQDQKWICDQLNTY